MDLVSIIVPVYNMEDFVDAGVETLLAQTYENIEILLIDDGSTDNSWYKCKAAAERDARVRCFHRDNCGSGPTRNAGIDNAKGKYLYFHDIDDTLMPDAIERLLNAMKEQDADLVVSGFEMFDGERVTQTVRREDGLMRRGEELRRDFYDHCFMYKERGILGAAWAKLFKAELVHEHNVQFPDLRRNQDEIFVARYTSYIDSVYFIGEPLCCYYVNNNSRRWDKYKSNYYDIAKRSTRYLTETVCAWNPDNTAVRNKIQFDYFYKTFLALWEQLNPKWKFSPFKQYQNIKAISKDYVENAYAGDFGAEENPVLKAMRGRHYLTLYLRLIVYTVKHRNE